MTAGLVSRPQSTYDGQPMNLRSLAVALLAILAAACSPAGSDAPPAAAAEARPAAPVFSSADLAASPLIIFLGDSVTAGLGLPQEQAYPARIQSRLSAEGRLVRIVNAGVSGDTSAGGLERLPWMLKQKPDVVVIALGANDGLRGQPVEALERNLAAMLALVREAGAKAVLAGMLVPPNYGEDYGKAFAEVFPRVAREAGAAYLPFLLEGVGGVPELNQADGIHPNAAGHEKIADHVLAALRGLLR